MKKVWFYLLSLIIQLIILFNVSFLFGDSSSFLVPPFLFALAGLIVLLIRKGKNYIGWGLILSSITGLLVFVLYVSANMHK
jgi:hypothetical protein